MISGIQIDYIGRCYYFPSSLAITFTIVTQITAPKDYWEHVIDAHVRMPTRAHCKTMDVLYANADQIIMENVALVSSRNMNHHIFFFHTFT